MENWKPVLGFEGLKDQEDWSESYINYLHSVPEGTRVATLDLHI